VPFKFRKQQRIKSPAEFKHVYNNKQWGNTRLLTFNALFVEQANVEQAGVETVKLQPQQRSQPSASQLGVTVSKKVSKLAVRRNQLKRLVREFYRQHASELHQTKLVITVKPAARVASNEEIRQELGELWAKVLKWQRWNAHKLKKRLLSHCY